MRLNSFNGAKKMGIFNIFRHNKQEEEMPMYLIAGLGNPGREYEMQGIISVFIRLII